MYYGNVHKLPINRHMAASLVSKLRKIPLMHERKRKLFLHDDVCRLPVDIQKAKRHKRSVFQPVTQTIDDASLEPLLEVYGTFRTQDADNQSDDLIAVIVGGPPPNSPLNNALQVVHKKLQAMRPLHQSPKIGTIEVAPGDVLGRTKARGAFVGQNNNNIVFTMQKKGYINRRPMSVLKGDTYFNKWPVPGIAMPQMPRVAHDEFDKIFAGLLNIII